MILSIDQSSITTGWAVFDGDELHRYGLLVLPTIDSAVIEERARNRKCLMNFIRDAVIEYHITTIVVEGLFLGVSQKMNPRGFATLVAMKAAIEDFCFDNKIRIFEFGTASSWRKVLGFKFTKDGKRLKSEELKQEARVVCIQKFPWIEQNLKLDVYEGICIGLAYNEVSK